MSDGQTSLEFRPSGIGKTRIIISKTASRTMTEDQIPLKAIPTASVNGKVVTLTADKSTGAIAKYGWAVDATTPTEMGSNNPVTFSAYSHKGPDFVPITVTVTKEGKYVFGLTVYDAENKQDYGLITIEVK